MLQARLLPGPRSPRVLFGESGSLKSDAEVVLAAVKQNGGLDNLENLTWQPTSEMSQVSPSSTQIDSFAAGAMSSLKPSAAADLCCSRSASAVQA